MISRGFIFCAATAILIPLTGAAIAQKPVSVSAKAVGAPVVTPTATVYLFVSPDCPIANRYTSRFAELARDYTAKNVRLVLVYSGGDAAYKQADLNQWAKEHGLQMLPTLRDTDAALAMQLHATTTPQAIITDPAEKIAYIGRIDDNADRERVTRQDTRTALDAVLAGKPVTTPRTRAVGCAIYIPEKSTGDAVTSVKGVTYSHDVAAILNKNCVSCHRRDAVGPFPLDSYAQAKIWASAIKQYTIARKMPPFKADPHFGGPFSGARTLTDTEIGTLTAWADSGAPSGDLKRAPAPPKPPTSEWSLGAPDMILQPAAPYKLDAEGADTYRDFAVSQPFEKDTYVKAMDFAPGTAGIVHHIITYIDVTGATCVENEGKSADGQPGWVVTGAGSGIKDWEWGSGWAPGMNAIPMPTGVAMKIPKGARLVMQIHYHKSGKPETDLSRMALYFAKPDEKITDYVRVATLGNPFLSLKPDVADNVVTATMILPYGATVHQIMPHMHLLGKEMTVTAKTPMGETIPMIQVRDWEFQWQMAYRYEKPIHLPKGTRLELRATFDNTANNPNQPFQPPREVKFGEGTTDEMCFAFMGLTRDPEPVPTVAGK